MTLAHFVEGPEFTERTGSEGCAVAFYVSKARIHAGHNNGYYSAQRVGTVASRVETCEPSIRGGTFACGGTGPVTGTPEQVKREGVHYLDACKPGGGYIYGTSHSIMPGAKCKNYCAMLDAFREQGAYRSA